MKISIRTHSTPEPVKPDLEFFLQDDPYSIALRVRDKNNTLEQTVLRIDKETGEACLVPFVSYKLGLPLSSGGRLKMKDI